MKKFISIFLCTIMLFSTFLFVGCSGKNKELTPEDGMTELTRLVSDDMTVAELLLRPENESKYIETKMTSFNNTSVDKTIEYTYFYPTLVYYQKTTVKGSEEKTSYMLFSNEGEGIYKCFTSNYKDGTAETVPEDVERTEQTITEEDYLKVRTTLMGILYSKEMIPESVSQITSVKKNGISTNMNTMYNMEIDFNQKEITEKEESFKYILSFNYKTTKIHAFTAYKTVKTNEDGNTADSVKILTQIDYNYPTTDGVTSIFTKLAFTDAERESIFGLKKAEV